MPVCVVGCYVAEKTNVTDSIELKTSAGVHIKTITGSGPTGMRHWPQARPRLS